MSDVFATSFGTLNYSGLLFNKGNVRTPLLSILGSKRMVSNSTEFVVGQYYTAPASGSVAQPEITETGSLTAPDATMFTRTQMTNVCQPFQRTFGVSYIRAANYGTLAGANIAGQKANPMNEYDFQLARKLEEVRADVEFTIVRGAYNKAAADNQANKSRGIATAVSTNTTNMSSAPLGIWNVIEMMKKIDAANAPTQGLTLIVDAVTLLQLNQDAVINGMTIVPASRNINGINLSTIMTPFGEVNILVEPYLASGTALLVNLGVCGIVEMIPPKGNFAVEELAKTGAGSKYQIFGLLGVDHGPEWYHGKFTNIATTFSPKDYSRSVYVSNAADFPVYEPEEDAGGAGGSGS